MTNHPSLPSSRRRLQMQVGMCLLLGFVLWTLGSGLSAADRKNDAAVKRTRKQVKMLDDLYKTAVVLITQHYVTEDSDLPAGTAAKALFAAMKKKGWHEVRLVDATGEPLNDENSPKDVFEKTSIKKLLAGKTWVEEVVKKDKKRHLRVTTAVPVVLEKCTMCHENYKNLPKGKAIGGLSYTVPIE